MSHIDSYKLEKLPYYDGPLGFELNEKETIFRLWAPTADEVTLNLYNDGLFGPKFKEKNLIKHHDGHWEVSIQKNLEGIYYDYLIKTNDTSFQTIDPYAISAGANGKRAMVLDLEKTNPEGWSEDKAPERKNDDIIYEIHVKDFTYQKFSGISDEARGKFLGLAQKNTHLTFDSTFPTGLEYLKSLGITHVQLMPIYDFGSVDEMGADNQFNWGYDPENYNVPEGSYSTDAEHGEVLNR